MSNDTKSLQAAAAKTEPKESGSSQANDSVTGPLELTAMVRQIRRTTMLILGRKSPKRAGTVLDCNHSN